MKKKLQRCWGYALCCIVLSASVYASLPICILPFAAHIIRCANTTEEKKTLFKGRKKLRRIAKRLRHEFFLIIKNLRIKFGRFFFNVNGRIISR